MPGTTRDLLRDIEAFLVEFGVSPTKFGLAAINDGHLVKNLRDGASVTLRTADKVRAYLAEQRSVSFPHTGPHAGLATTVPGGRLLLIIGGGIAAYKCLELIRRLRERQVAVRAVMTKAAQEFITPLAAGALTGERVGTELFDLDAEHDIGHIRLAREAALIVVAPATADLLAKMAGGHADDLASCVLMATDKPVLVAPAMNPRMWLNPATQRNVALLHADGVHFVGPEVGEMAERGEAGPGRMAEVPQLLAAIEHLLLEVAGINDASRDGAGAAPALAMAGRRVLVTAGPTHEPIDPVRYIANRSSGKQGTAIAAHARALGAQVTLVLGPSHIADPVGVEVVRVETAREMLAAVEAALPADVGVFAAAVADWRVASQAHDKIKKGGKALPRLELIENPDILKTIASARPGIRPPLVIGFAAETQNVLEYAKAKRRAKGADWIVANDVSPQTGIMGGDRNSVHLITAEGVESWPELDKDEVARRLMERAAERLAEITAAT
ncbi:MAG TPA: bifunctional phosphopantothenoylcysteine decarboxylase/phosphopantothenate--cysteine ligase CoaBC [Hyphomicrobiaceae bacterium]